jgi:hypothetical protein
MLLEMVANTIIAYPIVAFVMTTTSSAATVVLTIASLPALRLSFADRTVE